MESLYLSLPKPPAATSFVITSPVLILATPLLSTVRHLVPAGTSLIVYSTPSPDIVATTYSSATSLDISSTKTFKCYFH